MKPAPVAAQTATTYSVRFYPPTATRGPRRKVTRHRFGSAEGRVAWVPADRPASVIDAVRASGLAPEGSVLVFSGYSDAAGFLAEFVTGFAPSEGDYFGLTARKDS